MVDDDTYYWVYMSSNHTFQVYYKVRQLLLQSATAYFITKCDGLLLAVITKYDSFFITKCDGLLLAVITKYDSLFYYKVR